ncbi:MAG: hypothetical protein ACHQ0J_09370 [Candidatus Dormibacterales bacterium]
MLGERVTWSQPAGAAVILFGVALAQGAFHFANWRARVVHGQGGAAVIPDEA